MYTDNPSWAVDPSRRLDLIPWLGRPAIPIKVVVPDPALENSAGHTYNLKSGRILDG